jgi:DNA-binding NtrC family response regulator
MILVVDDDQTIVETLRSMLEREDYAVMTAADGFEAHELLREHECKCMILDVIMPKLNGIELLLLMQAEEIIVPTIVMAGFEDFEDQEMHQFSNVVAFYPKPFRLEDILETVRKYALP